MAPPNETFPSCPLCPQARHGGVKQRNETGKEPRKTWWEHEKWWKTWWINVNSTCFFKTWRHRFGNLAHSISWWAMNDKIARLLDGLHRWPIIDTKLHLKKSCPQILITQKLQTSTMPYCHITLWSNLVEPLIWCGFEWWLASSLANQSFLNLK